MCCRITTLWVLYILAVITALIAVFAPFWISTEVGTQVVKVNVSNSIDSGLFWKYEKFVVDEDSIPKADDSFEEIDATRFDTKGLERAKGPLLTGVALLVVSFIIAVLVMCCWDQTKRKIPFTINAICLMLSVVFKAVGLAVFFKQVLDDYELGENDEHLGPSFWVAVSSTVLTFLTCVCTVSNAFCVDESDLKKIHCCLNVCV